MAPNRATKATLERREDGMKTVSQKEEVYGYQSTIGPLTITLTKDGSVTGLSFGRWDKNQLPRGHRLRKRLDAYFRGEETLDTIHVALEVTGFQREVLEAIRKIPYGEVRTYGDVAAEVGRPRAARAVGGVMASNPVALILPCHRVVAAAGGGGYGAGMDRKEFLLRLESSGTASRS